MSLDVIRINILADEGGQGFLPDIFWKLVCIIEELNEEAYSGHSRLDFICIRGPRAAPSILQYGSQKLSSKYSSHIFDQIPFGRNSRLL
jgi:hypothetical protein